VVDAAVVDIVRNYLKEVRGAGIMASRAVLFGSYAKGTAVSDLSDIDVVIIAPEFDPKPDRGLVARLWRARATTDSRIEPIAAGEQQWLQDDESPLLEIARREGIEIK
jgi:predicted nucleotidyltransferase